MGQDFRQDWAISLPAIHAPLHILEKEWGLVTEVRDCSLIASIGAYAVIVFCGSFQGAEVFLRDLFGLRKCLNIQVGPGEAPHVVVPLLG
jgi:hypothetical protein